METIRSRACDVQLGLERGIHLESDLHRLERRHRVGRSPPAGRGPGRVAAGSRPPRRPVGRDRAAAPRARAAGESASTSEVCSSSSCSGGSSVAALGDRLREPVDRADRRAELVRGERDELALELVGPLQRRRGRRAPARRGAPGRAPSPVSEPSAASSFRSSSPKNGAKALVRTISRPNGSSQRATSPSPARRSTPYVPIRVPSVASRAIPRAPTILAIGGSTRSATSFSLVAAISSTIASCMRSCSGRRQSRRRVAGGAKPSRNATPLTLPISVTTSGAQRHLVTGGERGDERDRQRRRQRARASASASAPPMPRLRPARQRRIATMVSSTDQWTRNATT